MAALLDLIIKSKQGTIYNDKVEAISSKNEKGVFDILPEHENFISLIKENIIIHKKISENQEIKIENGLLRVYKNKINIYIGL